MGISASVIIIQVGQMEKKKHRKLKKILLVIGCVIVILAIGTFALLKNTFLKSFPKLTGEQRSENGMRWR